VQQPVAQIGGGPRNANVYELPEPPVVTSVKGVARLSLFVGWNEAKSLPQFEFETPNGPYFNGPTIRVNPGDTILLELKNVLPPAPSDKADINLHFHGLGTSPKPPADDVLGMLAQPGQELHYVVHVPKNQPPGLYWYHPHVHGQTSYQVGESGMSGAIIVNGLEHHLPRLAKMKERVIIVRDTGIGKERASGDAADGMPGMEAEQPQVINNEPCGPEIGLTPSLNGAPQPQITIAPGEKQFFRLINATGHKTLKLAVDGGKLEVVAIDGFALDTHHGTPPTLTEPSAVVPPAARVEFVVTGPRARTAKFRSLCYDTGPVGDRDPEIALASFVSPRGRGNGQAVPPSQLREAAPLPQNVYTTALPPVSAKRVVVFSETAKQFLINGKAFKMDDPPMFIVHVGTVEEWRILNVSDEVHDFHIHQVHFLIKEIDGVKLIHPYWADSTIIPHRKQNRQHPGSLLLLMDFRDPAIKGTFLFHCHILDHEDHGMMAKIEAI
jgi:FtsP/CotA-like multicopper oxidase with cupredoxin domain